MTSLFKFFAKSTSQTAAPGAPDPVLLERIKAVRQVNARQALNDQMSDIYLSRLQPPSAWVRFGLWATVLVMGVFVAWAAAFTLDEVITGSGKVIPTSREQVVQSMEAGIVSELLVKEGQMVEADQPLLRIDDVKLGSNMQESQSKVHALRAAAVRLRAEASGEALKFPAELSKSSPELVRVETETYHARHRSLESSLSALQQPLKLAQDELNITEPLAAKGLVSDIEVLRIKRTLAESRGRISELNAKFKADASAELGRIEAELGSQTATLVGRTDAFKRTVLKAPKKGIVKNIRVTTLGAVVQSGQDILEIVPVDDSLLIETRIRPTDIAFLRPGLTATVKVSAYDSGIYGWLEGELMQISPDTLRDEVKRDETYYRAIVKTKASGLKTMKGDWLPIIPGMQAQVDIKTGEKSVLSYLFKPMLRVREAFRER